MKTIVKNVALILILITVITTFSGCSENNKRIENLLAEFEYACNTLDVATILECINPEVSDKIKFAFSVYGFLSKKDTEEVFDKISEKLIGGVAIDGNDFFSSIKIEVKEIKVDGKKAVATAAIEYTIKGETFKKMADFDCIFYMEEWYIAKFRIR